MKERVGCVCENGEVGQSRHILFLSVLSISIFLSPVLCTPGPHSDFKQLYSAAAAAKLL